MDDAVARYRASSETNDIDGIIATLAPDAELFSPVSGHMVFRGSEDLRILLTAVYGGLRGFRWREQVGDGPTQVAIGGGKVGPVKLDDAMVFELAQDGRIHRIRPHLRPWLGLTFFTLKLVPAIARHPGVLLRALQQR